MNLEQIIDEAYELYMPQIKSEITSLAELVQSHKEGKENYNILEIGTKFGGTFYIWNKIVQDHGAGMCISVDMSDGGIHGGVGDDVMDKRDLWFAERFDNCHFVRGDSHDNDTGVKVALLIMQGQINRNQNVEFCNACDIDFLFIDGDHTYEGVKQDFIDFEPFCKVNSIISFHDINDSQRHRDRNVFVSKFWNELIENIDENGIISFKNKTFKVLEFNAHDEWAGIGCLIKL